MLRPGKLGRYEFGRHAKCLPGDVYQASGRKLAVDIVAAGKFGTTAIAMSVRSASTINKAHMDKLNW
eukprot:scaffold179119_cov39-Prasinocladus_malaysianus.AAC.1